jgi:DNA-binding NarL/FixJ family response regulator
VLLADDNPAVLDHVSKLLDRNQRYAVVGTTTNGAQVQGEYARLRPDVIVLDISMGDFSGLDVARDLRDAGCRAKIVFLTVHEDSDFMNAAMGAGGAAYVVKSRLAIDLIPAIDSVLSGKLFVSASLLHEHS